MMLLTLTLLQHEQNGSAESGNERRSRRDAECTVVILVVATISFANVARFNLSATLMSNRGQAATLEISLRSSDEATIVGCENWTNNWISANHSRAVCGCRSNTNVTAETCWWEECMVASGSSACSANV